MAHVMNTPLRRDVGSGSMMPAMDGVLHEHCTWEKYR